MFYLIFSLLCPQVPAFEGDDGFCVFESNAIAYYGNLQGYMGMGEFGGEGVQEGVSGDGYEGILQDLDWCWHSPRVLTFVFCLCSEQ